MFNLYDHLGRLIKDKINDLVEAHEEAERSSISQFKITRENSETTMIGNKEKQNDSSFIKWRVYPPKRRGGSKK